MRIMVTCYSQSGNTRKIAEAIYEELSSNGQDVCLKDLDEVTPQDLEDYDLVFFGSACHDADLAEPLIMFLENLPDAPAFKMAGFVTHSTTMPEGGSRNRELYLRWAGKCEGTWHRISQLKGIHNLGYFHCQGKPSPPIAAFIHHEIIQDEDEWDAYYHEVVQHPNQADLEAARDFARGVIDSLLPFMR